MTLELNNDALGLNAFEPVTANKPTPEQVASEDYFPPKQAEEIKRERSLDPSDWAGEPYNIWVSVFVDRYSRGDADAMKNFENLAPAHKKAIGEELDLRYETIARAQRLAAKSYAQRMFAGYPEAGQPLTAFNGTFVKMVKEELETLYATAQKEADRMIAEDAETRVAHHGEESTGDPYAAEGWLKTTMELTEGVGHSLRTLGDTLLGSMNDARLAMRGELPETEDDPGVLEPTEATDLAPERITRYVDSDPIGRKNVRIVVSGDDGETERMSQLLRSALGHYLIDESRQLAEDNRYQRSAHHAAHFSMRNEAVALADIADAYVAAWDMADAVEKDRRAANERDNAKAQVRSTDDVPF